MKKLLLLTIAVFLTVLGFSQGNNTFKYQITTPAVVLPNGDVQTQIDSKSNKADTTSLYTLVDRKGYADSLINARFKNLAFVNDSTLSWNVVTGGSTAWYHYTATRDSTTITPNWSGLLTGMAVGYDMNGTGPIADEIDSSPLTVNGTVSTQVTTSPVSTAMGNYVELGSGGYLRSAATTALQQDNQDWSIEGWFLVTSDAVTKYLFSRNDFTFSLWCGTNNTVNFRGYGVYLYGVGTTSSGTWHHVSVTYNYATKAINLYIDGAYNNTNTGISESAVNAANFTLGSSTNTTTIDLDGWNKYNKTLSASEVDSIYHKKLSNSGK